MVEAALGRGFLTPAQLEAAQRARAGTESTLLVALARYLSAPQQAELAAIWRRAAEGPRPTGWRPGAAFDGLELLERLGQGGMGVVFLAQDASGRKVAVKTLPDGATAALAVRFQREGETQARVDAHPNVLRVHRAGEAFGRRYLVLDYAEGGDLAARLATGPLPPREAARLVRDLARGLAHVHARGVLHRDLKPANVLFDAQGVPKLTDFGLARAEDSGSLTATGELLGTPAYAAPEQVSGERGAVGEGSDVYGLGAVLYHCLSGRPPFDGSTVLEVVRTILVRPPPPPRELVPEIPPELEAVCLRALAKAPEERWPSAAALAEALEAALRGQPPPRVCAPRGRRRALQAAGALALAAAAALAWTVGSPPGEPSPEPVAEDPRPRAASRPPEPARPTPLAAPPPLREGQLLRGAGWALAYGLSLAELRARVLELAPESLRLAAVTLNGDDAPRFAAVWTHDAGRFETLLEPVERVSAARAPLRQARLSATVVLPWAVAGGEHRIEVWRDAPSFTAYRHSAPAIARQIEAQRRDHRRELSWLSAGPATDGSGALFGVWEKIPPTVRSLDMDESTLVESLVTFRGLLRCVARYGLAKAPRYAGLWDREPAAGRRVVHGLSAEAFAAAATWAAEDGLVPAFVLEQGPPGARRYTASWRRGPPGSVEPYGEAPLAEALDDALLPLLRERPEVSRAAVAVVRGARLVGLRGYARPTPGARPARLEERFRLGPISQVLTAVATLKAVEAGRLRLDMTLAEASPHDARSLAAADPRVAAVTLHQLLRHCWGGPARTAGDAWKGDESLASDAPLPPRTAQEALVTLARRPLEDAPGSTVRPSLPGYLLLGRALEAASAAPYAEAVAQAVLRPLAARGFALARAGLNDRAPDEVLYEGDALTYGAGRRDTVVPLQYGGFALEAHAPAIGWVAAPAEVARLLAALSEPARSPLLAPATFELLWTPLLEHQQACAFEVEGPPSDPRAWIGGSMPGSAAHLERLPGGTGFVLLLNAEVDPAPLAAALREALLRQASWPTADLFEARRR